MEAFCSEVITPSGKGQKELGALKAGQSILPEKEIVAWIYKPLGNGHLIFPSKLNPDFALLSDGSLLNYQDVIKADQTLRTRGESLEGAADGTVRCEVHSPNHE